MSSTGSLNRRGQLAVALTIGFYALAIGLAGALLLIVYLQMFVAQETYVRLVIFCGLAAAIILWSIVPRRDKFEEPGPQLSPDQQPELFAVLRDVAEKTRQEMPSEVYLIPDVNAYVMYRGKRRVMGLGLTLMESLTVEQFRAVVAHEFGHYANDDLKYGAWVYRTREAIERTVQSLEQHSNFIDLPFKAYAKLFIRVTQEISRAQELAADRLAAAVTSARDAASALVAVERAGFVYFGYINNELAPVLSRGYRPPVAAGFAAFASAFSAPIETVLSEVLENATADVADSHPPLRERLDNLGVSIDVTASEGPRATSLLRDLPSLEGSLVITMWTDTEAASKFEYISWEEAAPRAFVPIWRDNVAENAEAFVGVTPVTIGSAFPRLHAKLPQMDEESRRGYASAMAGSALATRLFDLGWLCETTPGKPVAFTRDGQTIEPFTVADRLVRGELTMSQWEAECRAAGLESF